MENNELYDILKEKIEDGLPVFGTCAGLILLAAGTGIFLFLQKHGELWKGDEDDE